MSELTPGIRIHLIGAAGAGMSALAKLLQQLGLRVSGSDLRPGFELQSLADLGVEAWSGHRPEKISGVDLVVASSAVPDDDPELRAAAMSGLPTWRRPQLLRAISELIPTIGPTGTHGKTTSTAMLVAALRASGLDPSFVIGGDLIDLATNAHRGLTDLLVLEVDEAFGTFEHIKLSGLIVTNVEADHLDHFGDVEGVEAAFARVVQGVEGPVVLGDDDDGARALAKRSGRPTFGTSARARWRVTDLEGSAHRVSFRLQIPGRPSLAVTVGRPGFHNALNAAGVLALLDALAYDLEPAARGLAEFRGVRRRFEMRGQVGGVTMVDDYAHHPTEIAATIGAARKWGARLWAVFQPHLYSRTELLHQEFGRALARADRVVVTDVYGARESPRPGVTGELVAEAARRAGAVVAYVPHRADLAAFLADRVQPGDLVLTMGAGDVNLVASELAIRLAVGVDR